MNAVAEPRLDRLLGYLEADPQNVRLLTEAAEAAFELGDAASFDAILARAEAAAPLPPEVLNLRGLAALRREDFASAAVDFASVLDADPQAAPVCYNLAWCKAVLGDWPRVDELVDEALLDVAPDAAILKVQALHHLGRLDSALNFGEAALARRPQDSRLASAMASAALDAEKLDQAARLAEHAGGLPQADAVRGMLLLGQDQAQPAIAIFEDVLSRAPAEGRAQLGLGLAKMALGEYGAATRWIDEAADSFGAHAGSWVAAGWAHFAAGDLVASRQRFERAGQIDDAFAEVHGALAVLDVVGGQFDSARRRAEVALRLDRECFAAALARVLLLTQEGDVAAAERLRAVALNTPAGLGGRTIAQAMSTIGRRPGS